MMALKSPKGQGRCIFCGGTGLSKEHIWSDWLKELVPSSDRHGEHWAALHKDQGAKDIEWTEPAQSRDRQGSVLQRRIRNVCERHCNNGWMSGVVNCAKQHVRRLVTGESFVLDRQAQTELAAWIGITTIMQEFANRRGARKIPPEDRRYLMENGSPPASWSIWITAYSGEWWNPMDHYHIPITYSKPSQNEGCATASPENGLQLLTFTIRQLLVHVFTSTELEMIDNYRTYINEATNSEKLLQLWPMAREQLKWPPAPFTDDETDLLAFNWVQSAWNVRGLPGRPQEIEILNLFKRLAKSLESQISNAKTIDDP